MDYRSFCRLATLLASALAVVSAHAIVATSSSSTPLGADTLYTGVGKLLYDTGSLAGSGVAVETRKVLTVGHIGVSTTSTYVDGNGVSHAITGVTAAPKYTFSGGSTTTDLVLLTLGSDLTGVSLYNVANAASASGITMVGYGQTGMVNGVGNGYAVGGATGVRRAGDNAIDFSVLIASNGVAGGPNLVSFLDAPGEAALADKDSGGGWFQNGNLVGINTAILNLSDDDGALNSPRYANYGFGSANTAGYTFNGTFRPAGSAYFASSALDLTDPQIQRFLVANGVSPVPEPASFAALGVGALLLLRRRRRA